MGFFKKDKKEPKQKDENKGLARVNKIREIENHISREEWGDALFRINQILDLPDDIDAAEECMKMLIEDKELLRVEERDSGETSDGIHMQTFRANVGGGFLPTLMLWRGQCYLNLLVRVQQRHKEPKSILEDPEYIALVDKSILHASLADSFFSDSLDVLVFAASLFRVGCQLKRSKKILQFVLSKDPNHMLAKKSWDSFGY